MSKYLGQIHFFLMRNELFFQPLSAVEFDETDDGVIKDDDVIIKLKGENESLGTWTLLKDSATFCKGRQLMQKEICLHGV